MYAYPFCGGGGVGWGCCIGTKFDDVRLMVFLDPGRESICGCGVLCRGNMPFCIGGEAEA